MFQHSPNAYMVVDRELRYLEVNAAYERLTGRNRDELIGRCLFEVFPGAATQDGAAHAGQLRASIERAFATGERDVLALIPYVVAPDPETRPAHIRYWSATHTPLRDDRGRVVAVMQHTSDVTAVQQLHAEVRRAHATSGPTMEQMSEDVLARAATVQRANERLTARQAFLIDLFRQAPGFMAVLRGPEHVFELANQAYERLIDRKDIVGRSVRDLLPEVQGQGFFELLDQVRATDRPFIGRGVSLTVHAADGGSRTVFVDFVYQPIHDATGQVDSIFVQGSDVTDRETALAALRQSEQRFRTIADLVPQMIWSTRPDGHHDYFNQRWYDFTGVPAGLTDGDGWVDMFHPDDRAPAMDLWQRSVATGDPYEIEYRLRDRHGEYRWVLGRALPVRDTEGRIVRWMGTCTMIDEQKRVQEALERSRQALRLADRQKDQFLATLAHELRNPLSPIATAAHLLMMAPDQRDNVSRAAEIIQRQTEHMRHLLEDLTDVSRVTRGQATLHIEPLQLADVIAAAAEQAAPLISRRGHRLQVIDQAPALQVKADPLRMTQILSNLLNNAAKYTPEGGEIALEVTRDGDQAMVAVRDNGAGMAPDQVEHMFELFAQADTTPERAAGGLGIGLALARSLAQLHGGSLTGSSPGLGMGSTFELRLPLATASA